MPPPFVTSTTPVPEASPSTDSRSVGEASPPSTVVKCRTPPSPDIVAGDGEVGPRHLTERDPSRVGEPRDALVEVGEIERPRGGRPHGPMPAAKAPVAPAASVPPATVVAPA